MIPGCRRSKSQADIATRFGCQGGRTAVCKHELAATEAEARQTQPRATDICECHGYRRAFGTDLTRFGCQGGRTAVCKHELAASEAEARQTQPRATDICECHGYRRTFGTH